MLISLALGGALATAAPDRRDELRSFLQREFQHERDDLRKYRGQDPEIRYDAAFVDLNGDRRDEAIIYLRGDGLCGSGGCELYIYTPQGRSWREVTALSITRPPIRLLNGRSHGWRDIGVFVAGGGILPGYNTQLRFNGRSYPTNPTVAPARRMPEGAAGRVLIGSGTKGRPLF
jgi:hypothetical protein